MCIVIINNFESIVVLDFFDNFIYVVVFYIFYDRKSFCIWSCNFKNLKMVKYLIWNIRVNLKKNYVIYFYKFLKELKMM